MNALHRCVVVAVLACAAGAQSDAERTQAEVQRSQRQLQQNRGDLDRLLDLRMRHDLGLPMQDSGDLFRAGAPVTTEALEKARTELQVEDQNTASLLARFNKAKAMVEQLKSEAAVTAQRHKEDQEWVQVPRPGTPPPARDPAPAGETGNAGQVPPVPSAPAGVRVVPNLEPIRGQIQGSDDHSRVAQALFKAGQALVDRAVALRAQGQAAAADDLDAQAKERLVRALAEVQPQLAAKEPAFVDLFYLGKTRELLFRLAEQHEGLSLRASTKEWQKREQEVREPFLAITARDVEHRQGKGATDVLGLWGRAAQAALEQFRWLNLHGGFKPKTDLAAITWDGEKKQ